MGDKTKIEWADNTFNIVHGCTKVSEECLFCYALDRDKRMLYSPDLHWGPHAPRYKLAESSWAQPHKWNRRAERAGVRELVFCGSMCDVFEDHPDVATERLRLWELIAATPNLIWQLLTKRPQNILRMIPQTWANNGLPENVWAMTSAGSQQWFDERAPFLRNVPAKIRGFSCEPLLSAIEFKDALDGLDPKHIWVIAGGESGKGPATCRPSKHEWFADSGTSASRGACRSFSNNGATGTWTALIRATSPFGTWTEKNGISTRSISA